MIQVPAGVLVFDMARPPAGGRCPGDLNRNTDTGSVVLATVSSRQLEFDEDEQGRHLRLETPTVDPTSCE